MDKLVAAGSTGLPERAHKQRAVGSAGMDQDLKELAVNTAKCVVGLDGSNRRMQGVLGQVAIVQEGHPYLEPIKVGTKQYDDEKKQVSSSEEIGALVPAHVRAWVQLVTFVKNDASVPPEKKTALTAYHSSAGDLEAIRGHVLTCYQKKAYRQKAWGDTDRFKIELMVIPELRAVTNEIMAAIALKPGVEIKRGAPPRNPNVRKVVAGLVKIGEFQEMQQ